VAIRPPVGLLPAAGRGLRFGDSGYAKELFPLLFEGATDADLAPRPICELALRAMRAAGAERCVMVISRDKLEVVRVLGDGRAVGMSLGYVVQREPLGLPDVVRCARSWLAGAADGSDADVVFAMPDTVFLPQSAVADVHAHRLQAGADLALGVFPVNEPERLGPVELGPHGTVVAIHDKPGVTSHRNTWGVASWNARFTEFCCAWEETRVREAAAAPAGGRGREGVLGHVFEAALRAGLRVTALHFPEGRFLDIGTPLGLRAALGALATDGVLARDQAAVAPQAAPGGRGGDGDVT
jgi:glucose-1-phosphate thymidylyltransferase